MAGRFRAKKEKKQKSKTSKFVFVFMLVFTTVIGINFYNQMKGYAKLKQEESQIEQMIEEEREKGIELANKKEYYKSDAYIEKIAREQLGLIKPDEVLFINKAK